MKSLAELTLKRQHTHPDPRRHPQCWSLLQHNHWVLDLAYLFPDSSKAPASPFADPCSFLKYSYSFLKYSNVSSEILVRNFLVEITNTGSESVDTLP